MNPCFNDFCQFLAIFWPFLPISPEMHKAEKGPGVQARVVLMRKGLFCGGAFLDFLDFFPVGGTGGSYCRGTGGLPLQGGR